MKQIRGLFDTGVVGDSVPYCEGWNREMHDTCHEEVVWRVLVQSLVKGKAVGSPAPMHFCEAHYEGVLDSKGRDKHFEVVSKERIGG
jgi:hypothetical protein